MSDDKKNNKNDKKTILSADDAAIWQKMTQDVKKMPDKTYIQPKKPHQRTPKPSKPTQTSQNPSQSNSTDPSPHFPDAALCKTNTAQPGSSELDKRTDQRLRRGQLPIESTLDLHGMFKDQAHTAVSNFITSAYNSGKRCLIIITGKGKGGDGILRKNLPLWLKDNPLNEIVLKTYPAQPKDGGSGAFYIYLRKNKK